MPLALENSFGPTMNSVKFPIWQSNAFPYNSKGLNYRRKTCGIIMITYDEVPSPTCKTTSFLPSIGLLWWESTKLRGFSTVHFTLRTCCAASAVFHFPFPAALAASSKLINCCWPGLYWWDKNLTFKGNKHDKYCGIVLIHGGQCLWIT